MILLKFIFLYLICTDVSFAKINHNNMEFVKSFTIHQRKPANIVSLLENSLFESINITKWFSMSKLRFITQTNLDEIEKDDHVIFLGHLNDKNIHNILIEAQNRKLLTTPVRWILFVDTETNYVEYDIDTNATDEYNYYEDVGVEFSSKSLSNHNHAFKALVENILGDIKVAINTEVYIAANNFLHHNVFLVHRKRANWPLIWEFYGIWNQARGFVTPPPDKVLAIRRQNLEGLRTVSTSVILNNDTFGHCENYLHREVDTMTKYTYYMVKHLFEWVNGSGVMNATDSWGYMQQDGRFNGMIRELEEGRAEFIGSPLITTKDRMSIVEYVAPPLRFNAMFLFKKPALASVANIFTLPFSRGVWLCVLALIILSSFTLIITSYREQHFFTMNIGKGIFERISDGVLDTLCLVFQQGIAHDPVSISTRQILLLGLMAFMFLFTAYSANVVALLQTTTNEINSVEALLRSPLKVGVQDVPYNKVYFSTDTRPAHSGLWQTKLLPQGDKAFLSVQDGIRRVRQGMYAYHVERTAGFDELQRTFLENEKCNLGQVGFLAITDPYIAVAKESQIKEQIKIGIRRIIEGGVQARSSRRVLAAAPDCGASVAMFAAVTVGDVTPAFKTLLLAYAAAALLLALERIVHSHQRRNQAAILD